MSDDKPEVAPPIAKQRWAEPLVRFDHAWTKLESRLCAWVLMAEVFALCAWITLKGLSAEYEAADTGEKNVSGLVLRALIGAGVFGVIAHKATKGRLARAKGTAKFLAAKKVQRIAITGSVLVGLLAGRLWVNTGVGYFSNLLNWMQNASLLMLVGGLRKVATRLTLWLALLGASIATAKGKHINIDVVMRFLTPKMRIPVAVLGWVAAAVMCIAGTWGFIDHIAIALFHTRAYEPCADDPSKNCEVSPGEKLAQVKHAMGDDLFLVGRQLSLDLKSLPRVVAGTKYNEYLSATEWNAWVKEGDWGAHYTSDQVAGLLVPPDSPEKTHPPAVSIPGGEEARGLLVKDVDFIFPFGLMMIALRFLLRCLLVLSGHVRVDPDAAHEEEEVEEAHPDSESLLKAATKGDG
jgi:TRAP-type C4-dicarboxylate transport system permease small subunit